MASPAVICVLAGDHDRAVISTALRCALEGRAPYERVGIVGARELYDGVEWRRGASAEAELGRLGEHLAQAESAGLSHVIVEPPSGAATPDGAQLTCVLGEGGSGTVRAGERGLSFSSRSFLADVGASRVISGYGYLQFFAHTPTWVESVALPLPGSFNVGPALAAIATLELLGTPMEAVRDGLLRTGVTGHGELLFPPEHHVCALIEESAEATDRRRAVEAARSDFGDFVVEVVDDVAEIGQAVARGYARARRTLLVLLGSPGAACADAFQAAVRESFSWTEPPEC